MTVLREGDLQLAVPDGLQARRFDGSGWDASHCMKAVDFVLESQDRELFIEFKDPQHPEAPPFSPNDYLSRALVNELIGKFRDTFLYRWARCQVTKPIYYYVVVAIDSLTAYELAVQTDIVKRRLPVRAAMPDSWGRALVEDFALLNVAAWNRNFPALGLSRVSA